MADQAQDSPRSGNEIAPKWWPILCLLPFLGWWLTGLTDLDEGFYGAIASDMIRRGDFITTTLNGEPWFEKPILVYWLAIPAIKLFGLDWGPRLPSVLASLLTAWMLYRFASQNFSQKHGAFAALAASSSLVLAGIGRMMLTDAAFVAALTACFLLFWESINGRPALRWGAAACLGLAVLAKSPVAGFFFIVTAVAVYARWPELRKGFKGHWIGPILLGLGVIAAWYIPCWMANGQVFIQKYLIEQNLGRFAGGDLAHRVPVWSHPIYYPLVLAVGLLPWLPGAIRHGLFRREDASAPDSSVRFFLWAWTLSILLLFTLSGSKLPHYIAPALPPLILLLSIAVFKKDGLNFTRLVGQAAAWSVFVMAAANVIFFYEYQRVKGFELHGLARKLGSLPDPIVLYKFGRATSDVEIKLEINETSRPSLFFYLGRGATKTADLNVAVEGRTSPFLLMTTRGRLLEDELTQAETLGFSVEETELSTENYQVFRFTPLIASF